MEIKLLWRVVSLIAAYGQGFMQVGNYPKSAEPLPGFILKLKLRIKIEKYSSCFI